ncbi:M23 family metallopeptidase [Paraburkholderia kururiensis]|uniref:M23 family metallopeptidase n=2 Tax=Paraburkholderia kururiensis TaxID=984307 RepID=UPI001591B5FD|nr:M23 family metallopeptidase [Paraburkholderia kururiensis]
MMDAVDKFELAHGIYPVAADRSWHCGAHLAPDMHGPVHAIADGEVVAYRVCQHAMDDGNGNAGFVLLKHSTETGDGRTLTFYSLYMHLLPLAEYHTFGHDGARLPAFLHKPSGPDIRGKVTPAAKGSGEKVRRKDVLGFLGRYQGVTYLHFEIFMTQGDFDAYFGHTQLGVASPGTATTSDCWGHICFTIPAGQQFYALPQGTDAHGKLHGIAFKAGLAGTNALPLVVEMYFSKGAKYTNVWSVAADGSRTLLTPEPVEEKDYEYDLYHRATALYEACPSDGYEMLRFGRILSTPATLPEAARATWVQIPYDTGKQGYIDISKEEVRKLSDADFPSFMGWQKISDGNTPFDSDGLCDVEMLKRLVRDAAANDQPAVVKDATEVQKADALSYYVKGHDEVRRALRGFICNAPSEWDSTHNETRFAKLLDESGFYHGSRKGYEDFLKYLKELQFWDVTGLPAGQKLWFFHPLAFIRHFRKCGWLSLQEQIQLLPRKSISDAGGHISWVESKKRFVDGNDDSRGQSPKHMWLALNHMFKKYGFNSDLRKAHFLAQVLKETGALCSTRENGSADYFRKMYESYKASDAAYDFDNKYNWLKNLGFLKNRDRATYIAQRPGEVHAKAVAGGNVQSGDGPRFCGRGLIHLTWRKSYGEYGIYRGKDFTTDPNPALLQSDAETATDSAGYFWVKTRINRKADHGSSNTDVQGCFGVVGGAGGLPARQQFFRYAYFILGDTPKMPTDSTLERQTEEGA